MIVRVKPSGFASRRRAAFTLVEVLVVVAIVVILASVGTVATLTFLEGAREDTSRAKAQQLQTCAKAYAIKNEDIIRENQGRIPNLAVVTVYADDGERSLVDPWGGEMTYMYIPDAARNGEERLFIYAERNGRKFGAPKELEKLANGEQ